LGKGAPNNCNNQINDLFFAFLHQNNAHGAFFACKTDKNP